MKLKLVKSHLYEGMAISGVIGGLLIGVTHAAKMLVFQIPFGLGDAGVFALAASMMAAGAYYIAGEVRR